jgi:hypothetical protein
MERFTAGTGGSICWESRVAYLKLSVSAMISQYFTIRVLLLSIQNRLRCGFAQFKLGVHLL